MSNSSIHLVTRGDDVGMCHTANIAIRDAVEHGMLRRKSRQHIYPDKYLVLKHRTAIGSVECLWRTVYWHIAAKIM